jgi:hypothetical protein
MLQSQGYHAPERWIGLYKENGMPGHALHSYLSVPS